MAIQSCLAFPTQALTIPLPGEINIQYSVSVYDTKLGVLNTNIVRSDKGYIIHSKTQAEGLAAMLLGGNLSESCSFAVQGEFIKPLSFQSIKQGKKGYRNMTIYDWQARTITFADHNKIDMPSGYLLDNCNFYFAATLSQVNGFKENPIYVVDGVKNKVRAYKFKKTEKELLQTPSGEIDTIKVILTRLQEPEISFTFWLDAKRHYLPVKMMESRKRRKMVLSLIQMSF